MDPNLQPTRMPEPVGLSPDDAAAVDALLSSLHAGAGTKPGPDARSLKAKQLLDLIGTCPADSAPHDLVQKTLAKVSESQQRLRFAAQVQALTAPPIAFRWTELVAVAAVMMIAASLLLPMLTRHKADARRIACAQNLANIGSAMGRYTSDNDGSLPRYSVQAGTPWWNVGKVQDESQPIESNSANLFILARQNYTDASNLACPTNLYAMPKISAGMIDWPNAKATSYSYLSQFTPRAFRADRMANTAVLADKNPFFASRTGTVVEIDSPRLNSRSHDSKGQNVLRVTGEVLWTHDATLPGSDDNLWLVDGVRVYRGVEVPADAEDVFLVP